MKLQEEFKLFETMWDDIPSSEASTENRYIILTGDFPNKYYVHGLTSDGEKEAVDIYNKAMEQLPNFDCDIEVAELFDLTSDEISRLESMVGKEVTGADADFIADFFIDGSRVDSRYNNFTDEEDIIEESRQQKTKNVLNENKDMIYSFDLDAYNSSKDKMYTDKHNLSSYDVEGGYPYQFKGTYNEVVKKLNSIVKNGYDILMLFVENAATGEEVLGVDDRFLLYNKLVPANTPFLANVLTKHITEAPQRDWKARAKSVVDNDLFVDFDEPLEESAPINDSMYIIAANGEAGGDIYYMGTSKIDAQKEFQAVAKEWRELGLGGGDTPVCLYEYSGPEYIFDFVRADWEAGDDTTYDINIEELGISLSDCKVLASEYGN